MADQAVREAMNRIRAALVYAGETLPRGRITINLRPGWLPKGGTGYDLPIALAIITAVNGNSGVGSIGAVGELSLQGDILPVQGLLPQVQAIYREDVSYIFVPASNISELVSLDDPRILGIEHLKEALEIIRSQERFPAVAEDRAQKRIRQRKLDQNNRFEPINLPGTLRPNLYLRDLPGQRMAIRGLTAACAGGHHTLLIGSPGCGKTVLAGFAGALMPPLEKSVSTELLSIYSAAGLLNKVASTRYYPPIRHPHYTISVPNLIGGGINPKPGEISLAHGGILFIDEITSAAPATLSAMRLPLDIGYIELIRQYRSYKFPCQFILIGAANPCPCGNLLDQDNQTKCLCSSGSITHYHRKLEGAFADRIDIRIEVHKLSSNDLELTLKKANWIPVDKLQNQVIEARAMQRRRNGVNINQTTILNSNLPTDVLPEKLQLSKDGKRQAVRYAKLLNLSIRSFYKLLRLARTFADLDGSNAIETIHLAEALQYKQSQN